MSARQIPIAQQRARRAELDEARTRRALTAQERAEADSLTNRLYLREFRRSYARPRDRQRDAHHGA